MLPELLSLVVSLWLQAAAPPAAARAVPPMDASLLTPINAVVTDATLAGIRGLKVTVRDPARGEALVLLNGVTFTDGTIDVELAGAPGAGANEGARGFIGVAFRVRPDASTFEDVYLRPTNGRADDQLRRNHSTQDASFPDWPWDRLRKESPGVYESYVDLQPATWTHVRVAVEGTDLRLFVGQVEQPCLVVHDLKLGRGGGGAGVWIGPGTEGYVRNLVVTASKAGAR